MYWNSSPGLATLSPTQAPPMFWWEGNFLPEETSVEWPKQHCTDCCWTTWGKTLLHFSSASDGKCFFSGFLLLPFFPWHLLSLSQQQSQCPTMMDVSFQNTLSRRKRLLSVQRQQRQSCHGLSQLVDRGGLQLSLVKWRRGCWHQLTPLTATDQEKNLSTWQHFTAEPLAWNSVNICPKCCSLTFGLLLVAESGTSLRPSQGECVVWPGAD